MNYEVMNGNPCEWTPFIMWSYLILLVIRNAPPPPTRLLSIDNWSSRAWSSQHLWVVVVVFFIVVAIWYYSYTHEKRKDRGRKGNNLRSTIGFVFILIKWLWVVIFNYNKMLCVTLLAPTHTLVHKHKPNNIKPSYISRQTKRTYSPTTNNQSPKLGKKITNNNQNVYYIWASFEISKTKSESPKHIQKGWNLLNKK